TGTPHPESVGGVPDMDGRQASMASPETNLDGPKSLPQDQVAVAELMPTISIRNRLPVRLHDARQTDQRREHREMAGDGIVEARQQSVDRSDGISGMNEDTSESLSRSHAVRRPCGLERADDGGPDRDDAVAPIARAVHQVGGGR